MNMTLSLPAPVSVEQLHREFLSMLPQIVAVASFGFREVACPEKKADAIAEVLALSWKWFVRLDHLGRKDRAFPTALAGFAVKQVRSGRGVAGQRKPKDALNAQAQRRFNFKVEPLPSMRRQYANACNRPTVQRYLDAFEEVLQHNTVTPVPEQVQFRMDWPAWLATLGERDRHIIGDMSRGERTGDLADPYGLSPARISVNAAKQTILSRSSSRSQTAWARDSSS